MFKFWSGEGWRGAHEKRRSNQQKECCALCIVYIFWLEVFIFYLSLGENFCAVHLLYFPGYLLFYIGSHILRTSFIKNEVKLERAGRYFFTCTEVVFASFRTSWFKCLYAVVYL